MIKVKDIAKVIEDYAPLCLQESYDNAGLQVGDPEMCVQAVLFCLDCSEKTLEEAEKRGCNLIISHHPLIFKGIKQLTGQNATQRIAIRALQKGIAIYSAHTNLDKARGGVSYEMGNMLGLKNMRPLVPDAESHTTGLGVLGFIETTPQLEFLRRVKEVFKVRELRYSGETPRIVVRKVALCGGSGAGFIQDAIRENADVYITGDVKYHDFTTNGNDILLADIGHYESEYCSRNIFSRLVHEAYPDCVAYMSETESNPVKHL